MTYSRRLLILSYKPNNYLLNHDLAENNRDYT